MHGVRPDDIRLAATGRSGPRPLTDPRAGRPTKVADVLADGSQHDRSRETPRHTTCNTQQTADSYTVQRAQMVVAVGSVRSIEMFSEMFRDLAWFSALTGISYDVAVTFQPWLCTS